MLDATQNNDLKDTHNHWMINHPSRVLFLGLLISYLVTLGLIVKHGSHFVLPMDVLGKILLCLIPGFVISELDQLWESSLLAKPSRQIFVVFSLSFIILTTFWWWEVWIIAGAGVAFFRYRHYTISQIKLALMSMLALVIMFAFIWNVNTLLAFYVQVERIYDPVLWKFDLGLYSWLMGREVSTEGIFPLLKNQTLFVLLENAYCILVPEIVVMLLLCVRNGETMVTSYLVRLCAGYMIAFICFYLFPTLGPCFTPGFMHVDYQGTLTYQLLQGTVLGFDAIKQGIVEGGVAYFIALPSMHVSVATFLQVLLRPYRFLFWVFLPINILIIISTVILGYHYFLDVPAGIIVAVLSLIPRDWILLRRAQNQGSFKLLERSLSPISADH